MARERYQIADLTLDVGAVRVTRDDRVVSLPGLSFDLLVALAREVLHNPYWARHAAIALGEPDAYADWPIQYGHWLGLRAQGMFGGRAGDSDSENLKQQAVAESD